MFFFFNDTATTEIYTLSLHDALPISSMARTSCQTVAPTARWNFAPPQRSEDGIASRLVALKVFSNKYLYRELELDRKSTRLNSSHANISYAVFCLKKKNK